MNIVDKRTIKQVEKEKEQDTDFLTISYDIPSENRNNLNKEEKSRLRNKRVSLHNTMRLKGTPINQSVYVVRTKNVKNIIEKFVYLYGDSSFRDDVNLKIIGKCYEFVLKEFLIQQIDSKTDELKEEFEEDIEISIDETKNLNNFEKQREEYHRIEQKLYRKKNDINVLENRIDDLKVIDKGKGKKMEKRKSSLEKYRRNLLRQIR